MALGLVWWQFYGMPSFILCARPGFVVLALLSMAAWGQGLFLAGGGGGVSLGARAMSGAALVSEKGAWALSLNPAEVAVLRGADVFVSGAFSLSSAKFEASSSRRFFAKPYIAAAVRLPEGWALGLSWERTALTTLDASLEEGMRHMALHQTLANIACELTPVFRIGAALKLAVAESAWPDAGFRAGHLSWTTQAGVSVDVIPKRWTWALVWEEGLSFSSKTQRGLRLRTPHFLALGTWLGSTRAWEFEVNGAYGWQQGFGDEARELKVYEDTLGVRATFGLWVTPLIQLKAGGAVFVHMSPQASWLQPLDAWSGSLSAKALWRYGPARAEIAWQTTAGFAPSSPGPSPLGPQRPKQRISHCLSLGLGWSFH